MSQLDQAALFRCASVLSFISARQQNDTLLKRALLLDGRPDMDAFQGQKLEDLRALLRDMRHIEDELLNQI